MGHRLIAHLIESERAEGGQANSQEGRFGVSGRLVNVHPLRISDLLGALNQAGPTVGDVAQGDPEQRDAADHQQDALEQVGPHHGGQPAVDRVGAHADGNEQQHEQRSSTTSRRSEHDLENARLPA